MGRALTGMGLLALVCLVAVLGAATNGPWQVRPWWDLQLPQNQPTPSVTPAATNSQHPPLLPEGPQARPTATVDLSWLGWVLAGAAAVALVLVAIRLVRYWRRPRPEAAAPSEVIAAEGDPEPDAQTLRRGVGQAGDRLRAAGPPRDAIIAAWVAIEDAARRSGAPRRPAQTPTEHTTAVLRRTGADAAAAHQLLHVYQRARFAVTEPTEADVARAARALRRLAASWPELAGTAGSPEDD